MIVCICNDVSDRQIKAAIASGVDSVQALKQTVNVATCCGCCEPMVNDLLDKHQAKSGRHHGINQLAYAV